MIRSMKNFARINFCDPQILRVFAIQIFAKRAKNREIAKINLAKINPIKVAEMEFRERLLVGLR